MDKKIEYLTASKFEISEKKNYLDITYILASSVPNGNGALFTKDELEQSKDSILNTPLIITPNWDNLPTGHSDTFPQLNYEDHIIGTHITADIEADDAGTSHLKVKARVWKIRYPFVAANMVALYEQGQLNFSMEASYDNADDMGNGIRKLNNVQFIGSSVVDSPANPFSKALEIARLKGGKKVDLEQALKKIDELEKANKELTESVGSLKTEKANLESAKETLTETATTSNKKIDELSSELASLKAEKEEQELASKKEKRFTEIAQYVDYSDEEKAEKMTAFASMDEDVWKIVVETAKRNRKEEDTKKTEFASDMKLDLQKGFLDGLE